MRFARKTQAELMFIISLIILTFTQTSNGQAKCPILYPIIVDCEKCEFGRAGGYIDSKGKVVVEPKFEWAWEFSDGVGVVFIDEGTSGIVNLEGKITVFPKKTHPIPNFYESFAVGSIKGKYGIIDKMGKPVVIFPFEVESNEYRSPSSFSDGLAEIPILNGGIFFVDKTGKVVISLESGYNTSFNGFKDGMAIIRLENSAQEVIINKTGKFIFGPVSSKELSIFEPSDGLVRIQKNLVSPAKYINKEGKVVLEVPYHYAGDFAEGLAHIKIGDLWGYMNKKGEIVILPQFEGIENFSEGLAAVGINGKYGFINKKGEFVIPPQFSSVDTFKCGLAYVQKDGFGGYINKKGNWVWKRSVKNR